LRYLNFKSSIALIAVIASLSGCVGGKTPVKQVELPQWYLNAPANTGVFLYGEGEDAKLENAKSEALNNMASRLVVSVSSTLQTNTKSTLSDGKASYSKDVSKDVKVEVQKIKFTNAIVDKSIAIDGKFYLLMKVNRIELFEQKKGEFDSKDGRIDELYNSLKGKSKLAQIHLLQDIYPLVVEAKAQTIVLNAINNEFDYATYTKKYDKYIDSIDDIKRNCVIYVENNLKESYYSDILVDMLNRDKFQISNKEANSDIVIKLNNQVKYSLASDWHIAKVTTTISVLSNGNIVSNKVINTIGRSSTSKESALEDASKRFRETIEKETLDKIVFGK